ncbi:MAG: aminoglycoside phosphotransferase family enzyme/predicted kinase [Paracoccaceae bacterium]|jgi:aminoglycoside phosphotransferase family enzyme/predicted kinase
MDQADLIARLAAGETFGGKPPQRIDTHISVIFLTEDRAYKLKRALKTSYLDYTDIEARKRGSEREIALNRRTAPELYIRAVPITLDSQDCLSVGGDGMPLDWLVEMRRFDPNETFDVLATGNGLNDHLLTPLADQCAELHRRARVIEHASFPAMLTEVISGNRVELAAAGEAVFGSSAIEALTAQHEQSLQRLKGAMDQRARHHRVRECHGDLHLGNICLFDGRPLIFDAIEFNERFNAIDTLYDIGFLLMDLIAQNDIRAASTVFNRYLFRNPDYEELRVLPFYQSVRATIRAHVLAKSADQTTDRAKRTSLIAHARHYFKIAGTVLEETPPRVIAIGGYSGTGKSTLAKRIAPMIGTPPGAVILSSDLLRKRLYSVEPDSRLGAHLYRPEISDRVYGEMLKCADQVASQGLSVVVDATFMQAEGRTAIEKLAASHQIQFHGYWLTGDSTLLARRVADRPQGASDATLDVLRQQLANGPGDTAWQYIDTTDAAIDGVDLVRRDLHLPEVSR